ncbi:MAG: hypothetical protein HY908_24530 [Myxococcales bacterium]|nr:hypothetical protein [Myxococcales bacterium]
MRARIAPSLGLSTALDLAGGAHAAPPTATAPGPRPVLRMAVEPEPAPPAPLVWADVRAGLGAVFTEGLAPGGSWRVWRASARPARGPTCTRSASSSPSS